MTERKIGEVFLDSENFVAPKKVKCVKFTTCKTCIYQGSFSCKKIICTGEQFIETNEPLTTKKP